MQREREREIESQQAKDPMNISFGEVFNSFLFQSFPFVLVGNKMAKMLDNHDDDDE